MFVLQRPFVTFCTCLATLGTLSSLATNAQAYCRQTTCDDRNCPKDSSGCIAIGEPLFYDVACLSFAVDEGSAEPLGISDDEFADIVLQAFRNWQSVECPGGGRPSFEIDSAGTVAAHGIFFCEEEALNVSVWTLDASWGYEASSLGYTTSTFVVDTGEVFDADVELNLKRIQSLVPPGGDIAEALLSVATHEAGHFLGLAHSNDGNAVMASSYQNLRPRPLTEDDIEGICALYPPADDDLVCSEPGVTQAGINEGACERATADPLESEGSCRLARGRNDAPRAGWALLAFGVLTARRRRRPPKR